LNERTAKANGGKAIVKGELANQGQKSPVAGEVGHKNSVSTRQPRSRDKPGEVLRLLHVEMVQL
jgi:hypothetical protein